MDDEYNTKMVSAKIEESLYKKIKEMNMSVRELLWKGVRAVEGYEEEMKLMKEDIRNLRGSHKVLHGQMQELQRTMDFILEKFVKE